MAVVGRNQTYVRKVNTLMIVDELSHRETSGTDLKKLLCLSSATISSILNELLNKQIIKVSQTTSQYGKGRKRVLYSLNNIYGYILCVNISNLHAKISLSNLKCEVLDSIDIKIDKYDTNSIYQVILEASKLVMEAKEKLPLLNIVISVPGRVNKNTNELLLSKQFDEEIIRNNFIQKMFKKQFGENIPIYLANDINLFAIGEQIAGELKGVENAIFLSVDYGIGGSIIFENKIFDGDKGYAGEFGLVSAYQDGVSAPIDEFVSLRVLMNKASKIVKRDVLKDELFTLVKDNKEVHDLVMDSAKTLGAALTELINVLDISTVVISGKVVLFGDEYLKIVQDTMKNSVNKPQVLFSKLKDDGESIGAARYGVLKFFDRMVQMPNEEK